MKKILIVLAALWAGCAGEQSAMRSSGPLTVIAIGDAGESGRNLRANAQYISDMYTGRHDGGVFSAMIFLGDNFYNTGLNVPKDEVQGKIRDVLGPFTTVMQSLGRDRVLSIAGNHDYYAKNLLDVSFLFGLFSISEGPIGLTGRGIEREREIPWWSFFANMPASVQFPVGDGSQDSVQFILYDSSLPLRTDPSTWSPALDSLRRLLKASAQHPRIIWRVFAQHHPFYTVGVHGGYSEWNDETERVDYLPPCNRDSNATSFIKNWLDPEDVCTDRYAWQRDSLLAIIGESGAKIQAGLSGHDHSLQLLYYPDRDAGCPECPKVQIVSGAGAKESTVKYPSPPFEYTAFNTDVRRKGESHAGFAQLRFDRDRLRVVFFSALTGEPVDMGGGRTSFTIDRDGRLLTE